MVRRSSIGCGEAQLGCGEAQPGCDVAQLVMRRLAERQDRVQFSATQGGFLTELTSYGEMERDLYKWRRMNGLYEFVY